MNFIMDLHFSFIELFVIAILYGVTMKIADLLDEHGLRMFPGADLLFGIAWGACGSLLVLADPVVANVLLAQMVAYIVRRRLDYVNHAIGATMMIVAFVASTEFLPLLFGVFGVTFLLFGALRDYIGNVRTKRDWLYLVNEPAWYYVIPPAIYGLVTGEWLLFALLAVYRVSYNIVKYTAPRWGKVHSA